MKKIITILSIILIFIIIAITGYKIVTANEKVAAINDLLVSQEKKEVYLTPYGYTLDNPNVIINPYGISPLTALILFETKEELPVTLTINGKDENSTYTNTFESNKKHYIPVYGLYPNSITTINIKCGEKTKTLELKTDSLPKELLNIEPINNDTNKLIFITSDKYPYAVDNNNEIRWYLTKKYSKQINYLDNNHLLLSGENNPYTNNSNIILEIDLLGKIHKQYTLETPYLGTYEETDTTIIINSTPKIEIDKQTGTILNNNSTKTKIETLSKTISPTTQETYQSILPLYTTNQNYKITKSIKYNLTTKTATSTKNIFLVGYKKIDAIYKNYNIKINKTTENLQITGNFSDKDTVYLILDKFLDKKIYDIKEKHTIINNQGLSGQYSIYISINDTIYKTNNYIKI